jgi:hypothetical protein
VPRSLCSPLLLLIVSITQSFNALVEARVAECASSGGVKRQASAAAGVDTLSPFPVIHMNELQVVDCTLLSTASGGRDGAAVFVADWRGERVAVKKRDAAGEQTLTRDEQDALFREAQALASLRHPRVLCLYGAFVHEHGACLVSELFERTLEAAAYEGTLSDASKLQVR